MLFTASQQFLQRPRMVGNTSGHRWRHSKRGMNPAEVEVRGQKDNRPAVVFKLAGKPHCLARESAVEKAHRKIRSLRMVGRCTRHIRFANACLSPDRLANHRVEPADFAGMQKAVGLDFGGIVDGLTEHKSNTTMRRAIAFKAVRRDLKFAGHGTFQSTEKIVCGVGVAFPDVRMKDKLCAAFNGEVSVLVSAQQIVLQRVLLKATDEAKHFVYLDFFNRHVANLCRHELFAMASCRFQDVHYGVFAKIGQPTNGPDSDSFAEHLDNLRGLSGFNSHAVQRLLFGKGLPALEASEPLNNPVHIFETAKPFRFTVAAITRHSCLSVAGGVKVTVNRKIQQLLAANAFCCGLLVLLAPAGLCLSTRQHYQRHMDKGCPSEPIRGNK